MIYISCKHKLEIAGGNDFSTEQVTSTEAKELLTEVLGLEAKEMHLLVNALIRQG